MILYYTVSYFRITRLPGRLRCAASGGTIARGRRDASTHLRYKYGENLGCDAKAAVKVDNAADYRLPEFSRYTNYIFAREDYYFVYQTNFHEYERQFRGSFQHGGISLEEMVLPVAVLTPRGR